MAKVAKRFKAAGAFKLKVALTAKGKTLLKKSKTLRLTAIASFRPESGQPQSKSRTLSLKPH